MDEYIDMCLDMEVITLDVIHDYGKAHDIYKTSFGESVRVIDVEENSFRAAALLDRSIPACINTKDGTNISHSSILITSNIEIPTGECVFRISKVKDNPKRMYFLTYLHKRNEKRTRETILEEEVRSMKRQIYEMKNDIDILKNTIEVLIAMKSQTGDV